MKALTQLDHAILAAAVLDQARLVVATGAWRFQAKTPAEYLRSNTLAGSHVTDRFEAVIRDEWRKLENRRRKDEAV